MIQSIRSLGVQIALDDVGTGSSTLTAVLTLEPDWVKVDRTLIQGISRAPAKQRSLSQLVQLMGSGDRIIAEGVETYEDLRTVHGLGVRMSQGYYWSAPLSVDQMQCVIQEIERRRRELVKLAEDRSWSDPMVISKSREIDRLVTLYHRWGSANYGCLGVLHGWHDEAGGGGRMWRWWTAVWHRLRPSRAQRSLMPMPMEESLHDVDGLALPRHGTVTIWDNHIWIRNPDDQGAWATLVIPDDARFTVRIDGEKRIGEVVVQEGQRIEVVSLPKRHPSGLRRK